jgi:hypothetical protein
VSAYQALAVRDGRNWRIQLPGIGALQVQRLDDVEPLVRDVVATIRGVEPETLHIRVRFAERSATARRHRPDP